MYRIFIDTETTGLDAKRCGIIQIAGIIYKGDIENLIEMDRFDIYCQPITGDYVDTKALEANNITLKQIETFMKASEAKSRLLAILGKYVDKYNPKDKMLLYGYNISFDADFLRSWFEKMGDKYFGSWFWWPPIDVMGKAADHIDEKRPELENFKLSTVAKYLGVEVTDEALHNAMYDIELTVKVLQQIKLCNPQIGERKE